MNLKDIPTLLGNMFQWFISCATVGIVWWMVSYYHYHISEPDAYWFAIVHGFWLVILINIPAEFIYELYFQFIQCETKRNYTLSKTAQATRLAFVGVIFGIGIMIMSGDKPSDVKQSNQSSHTSKHIIK